MNQERGFQFKNESNETEAPNAETLGARQEQVRVSFDKGVIPDQKVLEWAGMVMKDGIPVSK